MRVGFGGGGSNADLGDVLFSWFEGGLVAVAGTVVVGPEASNGGE